MSSQIQQSPPQTQSQQQQQQQPGTIRVRRVGSYAIGKTIGEGTFGKVRLGTHMLTHERVALKVLEKNKIQNVADMKRITREIQILKLLDHPNVVKLLEVIDTPKHIYLVMEYVEGGELFDYIVAHQRVVEPEAVHFFRDIISGLDYCHKRHVIHRDLKPENLLIASDGHIKIVDFGLSNTIDTKNTLLKTACGSPCYAAPEMIAGKHYNGPCVDIWSTGVILYALTCGYLPFEDKTTALLYDRILKGRYSVPSHVSPLLKDLISRMLTVDPNRRITIAGTNGMKNGIIHHEWYLQGLTDAQREQIWREYGSGSPNDNEDPDGINDLCTDVYYNPQQISKSNQTRASGMEGTTGSNSSTASPSVVGGNPGGISVNCLPRIDFRILNIMINQLGFNTIHVKGAALPTQSNQPIAVILKNLYLNKHNQMTATYYLVAEREWKKEKKKIQEANAAKGIEVDPIQLPSVFPLDYKEQIKIAKSLGINIVPYPRNAVEGGDILPEFWDFLIDGVGNSSATPDKGIEDSEILCRTAGWIISYNKEEKNGKNNNDNNNDDDDASGKEKGELIAKLDIGAIGQKRMKERKPSAISISPEGRNEENNDPSIITSSENAPSPSTGVSGTERHGRTHDRERHHHRRSSNGQHGSSRTPGCKTERGHVPSNANYTERGHNSPTYDNVNAIPSGSVTSRRSDHVSRRTMINSSSVVSVEGSPLRMYIPNVEPNAEQRSKDNPSAIPGCDFLVSYLPAEELVRRVLQAASGTPDPSTGLSSLGLGVKIERNNPYTIKITTLSNHIAGSHATEPSTSSRTNSDDGKIKVGMPVRLEVEICTVKGYKGLHCIKTKRLAGGVWDYRIVICALLKRIKTE